MKTTLIIRDLPNYGLCYDAAFAFLHILGFQDSFDYLQICVNFKNFVNEGSIIVNMISSSLAQDLYHQLSNLPNISVDWYEIQGFAAISEFFQKQAPTYFPFEYCPRIFKKIL